MSSLFSLALTLLLHGLLFLWATSFFYRPTAAKPRPEIVTVLVISPTPLNSLTPPLTKTLTNTLTPPITAPFTPTLNPAFTPPVLANSFESSYEDKSLAQPSHVEKSATAVQTAEPTAEESDRYYLPDELSQPVQIVEDQAVKNLNLGIQQNVVMAIYINEAGTVDRIRLEQKGLLSEEEQEHLLNAFKQLKFAPGRRGEKNVKALYTIQLNVNQRTTIRY